MNGGVVYLCDNELCALMFDPKTKCIYFLSKSALKYSIFDKCSMASFEEFKKENQ